MIEVIPGITPGASWRIPASLGFQGGLESAQAEVVEEDPYGNLPEFPCHHQRKMTWRAVGGANVLQGIDWKLGDFELPGGFAVPKGGRRAIEVDGSRWVTFEADNKEVVSVEEWARKDQERTPFYQKKITRYSVNGLKEGRTFIRAMMGKGKRKRCLDQRWVSVKRYQEVKVQTWYFEDKNGNLSNRSRSSVSELIKSSRDYFFPQAHVEWRESNPGDLITKIKLGGKKAGGGSNIVPVTLADILNIIRPELKRRQGADLKAHLVVVPRLDTSYRPKPGAATHIFPGATDLPIILFPDMEGSERAVLAHEFAHVLTASSIPMLPHLNAEGHSEDTKDLLYRNLSSLTQRIRLEDADVMNASGLDSL